MNPTQPDVPAVQFSDADNALFKKVAWKIMPLLVACYIVAFLDRINIGYAQLQMGKALNLSNEAYALGAGIFFIGYFLFEVPSNLYLEKVGARKTLLRIMVLWGLTASAMMFVRNEAEFYVLRFLLGAFEAGFFPGIILYLTYWFPSAKRGNVTGIFLAATAIGPIFAGPISGWTLKHLDGVLGHGGWQWLFVTQGLPATILGIIAFFVLKDKPEKAGWLSTEEKARLRWHLDNDQGGVAAASHGSLFSMARDPKVYALALVYFMFLGGTYGMIFWLPTLVKSWGVADLQMIGFLTSLPAVFALVGMIAFCRHSDRRMERRWHFFWACTIGGAGILMAALTQGNLVLSLAGLCIMAIGQGAQTPLFFTAVSEFVPKKTAAGGIALISSLGNLGPATIPSVIAAVTAKTAGNAGGLYLVVALYLAAAILLMATVRQSVKAPAAKMVPA